jgi:hypothetical protein
VVQIADDDDEVHDLMKYSCRTLDASRETLRVPTREFIILRLPPTSNRTNTPERIHATAIWVSSSSRQALQVRPVRPFSRAAS